MLLDMDQEEFQRHVAFTLNHLLTQQAFLSNYVYGLLVMIADLKGTPLSSKAKRELRQDLNIFQEG